MFALACFLSFNNSITALYSRYMKTKIKYTDEPLGKIKVVEDFLPPPDQLAFKEDNVKVTITLSKASKGYKVFIFNRNS